jgi:energy-coupling factor transporter ATP-binding protein EcfA2
MTQASDLYALNHNECADLIAAVASETTVLVQGDMGAGKSSILNTLSQRMPDHHCVYFDATTKDLGDITIPMLKDLNGNDYVRFATNEELGLHLRDKPVILMIDEYGKANPAVKNALLRLMQERQIGSYTMHSDSLIFATTNLGAEGVGDLLPPHARNRIMVVRMAKPTHMQWLDWAINHELDFSLLGWVRDNPQLFQSFTDITDPEENPYIYHPRAVNRPAFVTPRSLHKASNLLKKRDKLLDNVVIAGLIGTIGDRAAMDLMAFVKLADDLPTLQSIKTKPEEAKIPTGAAAQCLIIYRTLTAIDRDWLDAWMVYLDRMPKEAQGMFANGVRAKGYSKQGMVMTNRSFSTWARTNSFLFAADV